MVSWKHDHPIHPPLRKLLASAFPEQVDPALSPAQPPDRIGTLGWSGEGEGWRRINLNRKRPMLHDIRYILAQTLTDAAGGAALVQDALHHSGITTTKCYAHRRRSLM